MSELLHPDIPASSADHPVCRLARELGEKHPPTDEQVRVADHALGPMLVVAGAGSGKTSTMGLRVAHLIAEQQVQPEEILGLTFTRKATSNLAAKIRHILTQLGARHGVQFTTQPTISTYSSFAASVARDFGVRLGFNPEAQLITDAHAHMLMRQIVANAEGNYELLHVLDERSVDYIATRARTFAAALRDNLYAVDQARAELLAHGRAIAETLMGDAGKSARHAVARALTVLLNRDKGTGRFIPLPLVPLAEQACCAKSDDAQVIYAIMARYMLLDFVAAYEEEKRNQGLVEFADQTAIATEVAKLEDVRALMRERYRLVLLDEFQDTSTTQLSLLSRLFGQGHAVTAVGDPHQSIYGWRGASAQALQQFTTDFSSPANPVVVRPLTVAFRNSTSILDAANHIVRPLRDACAVEVQPLRHRSVLTGGAGSNDEGQVVIHSCLNRASEAVDVARLIAHMWRPGRGESCAVLARNWGTLNAIARELEKAQIPHIRVGLKGLLTTPEVADIRALLTVAADASRGDAAMRLLTRLRLGVSDIEALRRWTQNHRTGQGELALSLVEVICQPCEEIQEQLGLSPAGQERLGYLRAAITQVRRSFAGSLEDIAVAAEKALGIDIDVLARPASQWVSARGNLDVFRTLARDFVNVNPESAGLDAFIDYLDSAVSEEDGLRQDASADDAINPADSDDDHAVQLMTIHASKGLEFDHVVIGGMQEGTFPHHDSRGSADANGNPNQSFPGDSGWLTDWAELPWALRRDRAVLPHLCEANPLYRGSSDLIANPMGAYAAVPANKILNTYKKAMGAFRLQEERRLAYVAMTRAKKTLVLTGALRAATSGRDLSRFLMELTGAAGHPLHEDSALATLIKDPDTDISPLWTAGFGEPPAVIDGREAYARISQLHGIDGELTLPTARREEYEETEEESVSAPYPRPDDNRHTALRRVAQMVHEGVYIPPAATDLTRAMLGLSEQGIAELIEEAELTLAHRQRRRREGIIDVVTPGKISATAVGAIRGNEQAFLQQQRRPLPQPPSQVAQLGTEFHRWIDDYYRRGGASIFALEGADIVPAEMDRWRATFLESRFASMQPVWVEESMELTLQVGHSRIAISGKIDAVFKRDDGSYLVVDWKTGAPPHDEQTWHRRSVQLEIYRYALAQAKGLDVETIDALFYYVSTGTEVPSKRIAPEELAGMLTLLDPVSRAETLGEEETPA